MCMDETMFCACTCSCGMKWNSVDRLCEAPTTQMIRDVAQLTFSLCLVKRDPTKTCENIEVNSTKLVASAVSGSGRSVYHALATLLLRKETCCALYVGLRDRKIR
jgi:hypothetical protein